MNGVRLWLIFLIMGMVFFPSAFNNILPSQIAGFTGPQFITMMAVMALVYLETTTPSHGGRSWTREKTIEVANFENVTLNGMKYDVHIRNKSIDLVPLGIPADPPEPVKPPTPMDNVLVRIQGRVNVLSKLESAEVTPENLKLYDDAVADLTKITTEVDSTPSLKDSNQYNDFVQALTLANELLIDVGARFGK